MPKPTASSQGVEGSGTPDTLSTTEPPGVASEKFQRERVALVPGTSGEKSAELVATRESRSAADPLTMLATVVDSAGPPVKKSSYVDVSVTATPLLNAIDNPVLL